MIGCGSASESLETQDGVRIFHRSVGSGSPIVVIHGGPGMDHESLAADLEPLAATHRLVFYDQRGGGRSSLPERDELLTIDHHVRDLEALRHHLGLDRMTLLAHSFGPAIAALYAAEHPDRVERMIFLGPIPPRRSTFFEDYGAELNARLSNGQRKRLDELSAEIVSARGDAKKACREFWAIATPPRLAASMDVSVVKSDLCTATPEAIRYGMGRTNPATFASLGDWDWSARLARVTAPTLVIHGEEDAIPLRLVREWETALPNARLVALPRTGHFPHAERPEETFGAIEAFLAAGAR